jgi:hypothetical protein
MFAGIHKESAVLAFFIVVAISQIFPPKGMSKIQIIF